MSDAIVIEYQARLERMEAQLRRLEKDMLGVEDAARDSGKEIEKSFKKGGKDVDEFGKKVKKGEKEIGGLSKGVESLGKLLLAAFSVQQLISFGRHVVEVTGQFQRLEAVLTNTLGSKSAAQRALAQIQVFAARTPFAVNELTESYVKLANQGFKPTVEELQRLGDLASSTGKGFDQLTEAIIDAQVGEFERLKEFGIRASKEGDNVTFTFKGVQQQVDFTNESIREYILSLGEAEGVSGSMAAISETVEGKISNLGDAWDQLGLAIGNSNGVISDTIGYLSELVTVLTEAITSSEDLIRRNFSSTAEAYYNQQTERIKSFAEEIKKTGRDVQVALELQRKQEVSALETILAENQKKLDEFDKKNPGGFFGSGVAKGMFRMSEEDEAERQKLLTNVIQVQEYLKALNDAYREAAKVADTTEVTPTQEELDKAFDAQMKLLDAQEKFALRRAVLEGKTEQELIAIQQEFNERKIAKIKEFGKEAELIYEDHLIRRDELEQQYHQAWLDLKRKEAQELGKAEKEGTEKLKEELEKRHEASRKFAKDYADFMVQKEKEAAERRAQVQEGFFAISEQLLDGFHERAREKRQAEFEEQLAQSEQQTNNEIALIDKQLEAGLISEAKANAKKEALLQRQREREAAIKKRAWIADRDAAARKARIDAAAASVKTLATLGIPAGLIPAALALAQGLIQAGFISSQQPPKFAKGVIDLKGPGTGTSDSIPARLSRGESVMTAKETMQYKPVLKSMRKGEFEDYIQKNYVLPVLKDKIKKKADFEIRKQNTAEQMVEAMKLNGIMDLSNVERQLRKNKGVRVENIEDLAKAMNSRYGYNDL